MNIKDIKNGVMIVTPEFAEYLLRHNTSNRQVSKDTVDHYADMINRGQWKLGTDTIGITKSGKLINGQQRLLACIKANKPIELGFTVDLEEDAIYVLDNGRKRLAAHVLGILGYQNSTMLAAAVRKIIMFEQGKYNFSDSQKKINMQISSEDLVEFIESNNYTMYLSHNLNKTNKYNFGAVTDSLANMVHYIFSKINIDKADEFMYLYKTGDGLSNDSPIKQTRLKIESLRAKQHRKLTEKEIIIYLFRAWNLWVQGKPLINIRTVSNDDKMPILIHPTVEVSNENN